MPDANMNAFDKHLLGQAPEFLALIRSAQVAAATEVNLLLLGESGTGKELLARAVHEESPRRDAPFITINCAALPEALAESELFGHRRGAFTGALEDKCGRIRAAEGGTLFLDEVGELPLNIQAKLLRFLESGECQALGESGCYRADVRVIAATHRDLHAMVREGQFREDLFYRLNIIPLEIPPLRQRSGDIPLLLQALGAELAAKHALEQPHFDKATRERLNSYAWPGNIRELRNFCERMLVLFNGREVSLENLPAEMREPVDGGTFALPDEGIRLDELEQSMIRQALAKTFGNRSRAARLLGLSRDTLLYRLKKYAID